MQFVSFAEISEPPLYTPTLVSEGLISLLLFFFLKFETIVLINIICFGFTLRRYPEDYEEQQVYNMKPGSSSTERVQEAVDCLPKDAEFAVNSNSDSNFRRWTIMDYSRAYSSRQTTPHLVYNEFLDSFHHESSNFL